MSHYDEERNEMQNIAEALFYIGDAIIALGLNNAGGTGMGAIELLAKTVKEGMEGSGGAIAYQLEVMQETGLPIKGDIGTNGTVYNDNSTALDRIADALSEIADNMKDKA
jgi:hypothetical protein